MSLFVFNPNNSVQQGRSPVHTTCNSGSFFTSEARAVKQAKAHKPVIGPTYNNNTKGKVKKRKKVSQKNAKQMEIRYAKQEDTRKEIGLPQKKIDHHKEAYAIRKEIIPYSEKVRSCQTPLLSKVGVTRNGYTSLTTCKSKVCPHCLMRKEEDNRKKVQSVIEQSLLSGYTVMFFTFTGKHNRFESYEQLRKELIKSFTKILSNSKYKKLKEEYDVIGFIKKVEETFQITNGWHNHLHVLFILDSDKNADDFINQMFKMWSNQYLKNYGKKLDRKGFIAKEISCHEGISRYMSKSWSISDEMTMSSKKRGKGIHPIHLIRKYNETGNKRYLSAFKEYESTQYYKAVTFSHGIKTHFSYEVMLKYDQIKNSALKQRKKQLSEEDKMLFDPNKVLFDVEKELFLKIRNTSIPANVLEIINNTYHSQSDFWTMIENVELYFSDGVGLNVFFAGNCFYIAEEKNISLMENAIDECVLNACIGYMSEIAVLI